MARRRAWADHQFSGGTVLSAGVPTRADLLANVPTQYDTITVTRLIVDFWCFAGPSNEVEGLARVSCGIGVTSAEALAAGVVSDPSVVTEYPPGGWLYVAELPAAQALPTGGTPVTMWRQDAHFHADIRAMRKVDKGKLYVNLENTTISGALTLFVIGRIRALCLT